MIVDSEYIKSLSDDDFVAFFVQNPSYFEYFKLFETDLLQKLFQAYFCPSKREFSLKVKYLRSRVIRFFKLFEDCPNDRLPNE